MKKIVGIILAIMGIAIAAISLISKTLNLFP